MLRTFGAALLTACGWITADPARVLQIIVTQVNKNPNGSITYHFAVNTEEGESLAPAESKATGDFVTTSSFFGLRDGQAKIAGGMGVVVRTIRQNANVEMDRGPVLPVDIPVTPNLSWTVTKPVGGQKSGFTATSPHERDGAGRIHGASHAASAYCSGRRHRNAQCHGYFPAYKLSGRGPPVLA